MTTEGGLDVAGNKEEVGGVVRRLRDAGIIVALFIDPADRQIDAAQDAGATAVEFHTGPYAEARSRKAAEEQLLFLAHASDRAVGQGLHVHMGHGLNYSNVKPVVRIPGVEEVNIGHSIVSRAVLVGLERAVREMREAMTEHFPNQRR